MSEDGEFKIKGAASRPTSAHSQKSSLSDQPASAASKTQDAAQMADQVNEFEDGEIETTGPTAEELATYKWYKCETDPAQYPNNPYYYVHADTNESRWDEPDEPYFVYSIDAGGADKAAGLQYPEQSKTSSAAASSPNLAEYKGYNPKIHGDYDPNAEYAQYHNQKRAEEAAAADPYASLNPAANGYISTMALNRFTGSVQASHLSADRHSDEAKSNRQMGAFMDVNLAANANEGRSLKEERKEKKPTKKEIKQFNKARREKKHKKRMDFYTS